MKFKEFTLKSEDGKEIYACCWMPKKKPTAIVQISHGMAEHINRYHGFAEALADEGFAVYGNDHRGHGKTTGSVEAVGYFADNDGWDKVLHDMRLLTEKAVEEYPKIPVFLFGHSMGSLFSRNYIMEYGDSLSGVILSGTAGDPGLLGKIGRIIAKSELKRNGKKALSPKLNALSFGSFNSAFKPNRTDFDWLSRDNAEVDKYINDPFCGGIFTVGFFNDFLMGISRINKSTNIAKIPENLPVYLFSGDKDPVGKDSKGVLKAAAALKRAGVSNISVKFYKDGRHEMLNEPNKDEVYRDVISWIRDKC